MSKIAPLLFMTSLFLVIVCFALEIEIGMIQWIGVAATGLLTVSSWMNAGKRNKADPLSGTLAAMPKKPRAPVYHELEKPKPRRR